MIAFLSVAVLSACATGPARLDTEVFTCCEADFFRYKTYEVSMTNVPGFLQAYLQAGLTTVLDQKGLITAFDDPDLKINILFNQVYLTAESEPEDYFSAGVAPGESTRFMAAIAVDVIDADTQQIVWSGRLSRIHSDPHGEPRGNDHKMQGIIDGFAELFRDYPIRLGDADSQPENP